MPSETPHADSQQQQQQQGNSSSRGQQQQQQQNQQQQSRRRTGAPSLADLGSANARAPAQVAARSRVQQQQAGAAPSSTNSADNNKGGRSRLTPPLAAAAPSTHQQQATPPRSSFAAQVFSVFTNPLSSAAQADANGSGIGHPSRSRAAASIAAAAADSPQPAEPAAVDAAPAAAGQAAPTAAAADASSDTAVDAAQAGSLSSRPLTSSKLQDPGLLGQRTYCFEVQAADSEAEAQLIDYNGHDQHSEQGTHAHAGQLQQLGGSIQQYVYDEDTGQLCRTGEGAETTRLGRHYLEDCHTGEFYQLAQQPTGGWWAWIRRRPHLGTDGWFRRAGGEQGDHQQQQEQGFLHSLSQFLDTMGSGMAALGLFAQGLAGGLALLCLFMTYIQYATAGKQGFLAFYSPQAEMINRTFFTLISISLVAAASRHAYDQLGHFCPRSLRLGLVDSCVMLLYFLAYACNLLATPLDDQLAFEARRDPAFFTLPLPAAFEGRLGLWHGLNLVRVAACGLAWVLVCYRSNHFVMLQVFEARRLELQQLQQGYNNQQQQQQQGAAGAGGGDAGRRLQRMGAVMGSFGDRSGGGTQGQLQQWASRRFSGSGGGIGTCPGGASSASAGWSPDQRRLMAGQPLSSG